MSSISEIFMNAPEVIPTDTDRLAWVQQIKKMNSQHWRTNKIAYSIGNMKKLWWTLLDIMGKKTYKADDSNHTANDFANFFNNKDEAVNISVPLQDIPHMMTDVSQLIFNIDT